MILTANLGALTVVNAFFVSLKPGFIQPARHSVHTNTEGWNHERVNDVGSCNLQLHNFIYWNHSLIINRKEPDVAWL